VKKIEDSRATNNNLGLGIVKLGGRCPKVQKELKSTKKTNVPLERTRGKILCTIIGKEWGCHHISETQKKKKKK